MTKKIMLDAGHGGKDGGAQGNGLSEKELTLTIAKMIEQHLGEYEGIEVRQTRSDDRFLALDERTIMANRFGADIFISIHINSAPGTAGDGFESFRYNATNSDETKALQNVVHRRIMATAPLFYDRGQKSANFHVLRESQMPALLIENGFINNPNNARLLKINANLEKLALGHAQGIAEFLGLKKKTTEPPRQELKPTTVPPIATTGAKLFKVQLGAFEDQANAIKLANELIDKGYKPYVFEE